jgi:hypothetical protein
MVWKGIQVHDVPTKDPNHPFPTITIDLDTSYNRHEDLNFKSKQT